MKCFENIIAALNDLRCWIKHFYEQSSIPELTRIKALQRCMNYLTNIIRMVWEDFAVTDDSHKKIDYLELIKTILSLFDWLCRQDKYNFVFNEESGEANIYFIINKCNFVLSQFRHPINQEKITNFSNEKKQDSSSSKKNKLETLENLTFDDKENTRVQSKRRYDIFPFTGIGCIL